MGFNGTNSLEIAGGHGHLQTLVLFFDHVLPLLKIPHLRIAPDSFEHDKKYNL